MKKNKVFLLELNEFNIELLQQAVRSLPLKNIKKMLVLHQTELTTQDTYESDFLEPWVQWVSIHTGKPSTEHQIKHLGDVPHLGTKQLWEELSERGVSSGIWGAMNASKGGADKALFFLPDPWTASEDAYPGELNALLEPVRYLSKNYLNRSNKVLWQKVRDVKRLFWKNHLGKEILKELPVLIKNIIRYPGKSFVFISFFDYFSTLLFLAYRKQRKPDFSLLFLNSLAHLQHHHWKEIDPKENSPLVYGLTYLDRILGKIFASLGRDEIFLVTNALSQKNTSEEPPWILYRQKDQGEFLKALGIRYRKVEPLMTHDAHIHFASEKGALLAKKKLDNIVVNGQKLFLVEEYPQDRTKLFYRVCFTDKLSEEARFSVGRKKFSFFQFFQPIVQRTGKHIPKGTLFSNRELFLETLQNHEVFHHIRQLYE